MNFLLFNLSIRGLGILNYESMRASGELEWLNKHLKGLVNPIVFDVGANTGDYVKAVFQANGSASVLAFEPHPENFYALVESTRQLKREAKDLRLFALGLASRSGSSELFDYLDKDGSPHASLFKAVIEGIHREPSTSHPVELVSLDVFCAENGIDRIDLLKIDTEGNEYDCLEGSRRMLTEGRIDVIHFEFNEMNLVSGSSFRKFWDLLEGYSFGRLLADGSLFHLKQYSAVSCELYAFQNIIAFRDACHTRCL